MTAVTLTAAERDAVQAYADIAERYAHLQRQEDDAFARYMGEPTPSRASTARKAKSRVNAISASVVCAEPWDVMDAMIDDGRLPGNYHCDLARFVIEVLA